MTYRKKTLRGMPAATREVAKIINEVGSIERRLANRLPRLEELERVARQWDKGLCARQDHAGLVDRLDQAFLGLADVRRGIEDGTYLACADLQERIEEILAQAPEGLLLDGIFGARAAQD